MSVRKKTIGGRASSDYGVLLARMREDQAELREREMNSKRILSKRRRNNFVFLGVLGLFVCSVYGGLRYKYQVNTIGNVLDNVEPLPPSDSRPETQLAEE
uniref:Cytochrome c oxidase assembly factor 3 n=1 Tax=Rhodosorus marinus TaxID=101924 RepID=A0A6T6MNA4_9RHOD|mmetsp:Transcript_23132/g.33208  ORF Transcript_23132/g.33208 Transcript_23132/m.33208 type:complete len:100 (+) Transcript_23132:235-534(+)